MAPSPWPAEWHRPMAGGWARVALLAAPAAWFVFAVTPYGNNKDGAGGTVIALAAAAALLAQVAVVWPRYRGTPRHDAARGALALPFSRARVAGRIGTWAPIGAMFVGYGGVHSPWLVVGVAWAAATPVVVLVRRPWRRELRLSPDGVTYASGTAERFRRWADVRGVAARDEVDSYRGIVVHHPLVVVQATGEPLVVRAAELAVDPALAYWAARCYADHPEARAELADGRAVDRLRRGDLRCGGRR